MSIWFSLLIPIIGAFVMLKWFSRNLTWWEVVIPLASCFLFITIFKLIVETVEVNDTEYHGAIITEARYYEYWETYVHKTCTRTVSCGKNCTTTVTYDCSYCDENPARWTVINSLGQEFSITQDFYNYLMKKWKSGQTFVELNRDISDGGFGCGQDGDMYKISWDGDPMTSESTTTDHWYENRVQAAHTAFDFPDVSEEDVSSYGLMDYPEMDGILQKTVLGMENVNWMSETERDRMEQWGKYLNGHLGTKKHARIYVLFFVDKPQISANMQEAYWDGGNDNEIVICIGLSNKSRKIQWVRPFTWSPERRIIPDVREAILSKEDFDPNEVSRSIMKYVDLEFRRKDFQEFSYITVEPPTWAKWVTFIVTILITFGLCYWAIVNDVNSEDDPLKNFLRDRF